MAGWYYISGDNWEREGPVTWEELRQFAASGKLREDDAVWRPGESNQIAASQVPELFLTTKPAAPLSPDEPPPFPPTFRSSRTSAPPRSRVSGEPPPVAPSFTRELPKQILIAKGGRRKRLFAQLFLALCYGLGSGVRQLTWFRKAAAQGETNATSFPRRLSLWQAYIAALNGQRQMTVGERRKCAVIIIGGCVLTLFGVVFAVLLSGTSRKPSGSGGSFTSHTGPAGQSSSLPVPADHDSLGRALEEADRLWDNGQKAEAASRYSVAMESPCLAEYKEVVLQRLLPRVTGYYADQHNEAALDNVFRHALEKGISLQHPDPVVQQHFDELKAQVVKDRLLRQFQELGIPTPEGPVTQEFVDAANEGLSHGRGMVGILRGVANLPSGVHPVVREEATQKQLDRCLDLLNGIERGNAEMVSSIRAQGGDPWRLLQRRLGFAAGLRAAFRKAGIVP